MISDKIHTLNSSILVHSFFRELPNPLSSEAVTLSITTKISTYFSTSRNDWIVVAMPFTEGIRHTHVVTRNEMRPWVFNWHNKHIDNPSLDELYKQVKSVLSKIMSYKKPYSIQTMHLYMCFSDFVQEHPCT